MGGDSMKTVAIVLASLLVIGCGDGSSSRQVATQGELITPYGSGTIADKYVINTRGLYKTNDFETYYKTSLLESSCALVLDPVDNDIYDVKFYDGSYSPVPYDFVNGKWIATIPSTDRYNIVVKTYQATMFNLDATCWN